MRNEQVLILTRAAIFVALYVATTVLNPIGSGFIQFRISEVLLIIPFIDRRFVVPAIIGVGVANIFSPLGLIDVGVGLSIAVIAYGLVTRIPNIYAVIIAYAVLCGLIVGSALSYVYGVPYLYAFASVSASQLLIGFIALPLIYRLQRSGLIINMRENKGSEL